MFPPLKSETYLSLNVIFFKCLAFVVTKFFVGYKKLYISVKIKYYFLPPRPVAWVLNTLNTPVGSLDFIYNVSKNV